MPDHRLTRAWLLRHVPQQGALIAEQIGQMRHDRFTYQVEEQRGRWVVHVDTDLTDLDVPQLKLDVGPPCWLEPDRRPFEPMGVHDAYLFDLPHLPIMQLAENLAQKIARLTRLSAARDASDLVWAATTTPYSQMDRDLMRQLPRLEDLEADLRRYFQWLGDLDDDARRFAAADRRDEADIVDAVAALPGSALTADVLWSHPR